MPDDDNIVQFKTRVPAASLKPFAHDDPRAKCKHESIEIWPAPDPIIECAVCGVIVDPYYWIRERCSDWKQAQDAVDYKISQAEAELKELKAAIKLMRGKYKDEVEKRRAEREIMTLPPRRRV